VSDPSVSCGLGCYKLRFPILSAIKSRDPKTNLESGRNLSVDLNDIDLTYINLVSPTVGANCCGL
jgi:hypothetical protein